MSVSGSFIWVKKGSKSPEFERSRLGIVRYSWLRDQGLSRLINTYFPERYQMNLDMRSLT